MNWRSPLSVVLSLGWALGFVVPAAQGETRWKMCVHGGDRVDTYNLADVDSITFHADVVPSQVAVVPAGTFSFGDGVSGCGRDQRRVTLTRDFYLGRYEVTNQQYLEAAQWAYDNGYVTATPTALTDNLDGGGAPLLDLSSQWCEIAFSAGTFTLRDAGFGIHPDNPVMEVTWYGAVRYCDWLSMQAGLPRAYRHSGDWVCNGGDPYGAIGYRLPTESEWEFAGQYNDERLFPWGDQAPDCTIANCWSGDWYCIGWTVPVGSYPAAPATLGLHDMAGNVHEWCNDWFLCELGTCAAVDPVGPPGGLYRCIRGGSWGDPASLLRVANRILYPPLSPGPEYAHRNLGFRIAKTVNP